MGHTVEVLVYNASNVLQGTIDRVINFESRGALNEIGDAWFEIASDDTEYRSLISKYSVCVIRADLNTATDVVLQQFIVKKYYDKVGSDGRSVFRVEGPDLLDDLNRRSLGFNTISDGAGGQSTVPLSTIDAYADNSWSPNQFGSPTSTNYAYLQASGETVWEGIQEVVRQGGGNISLFTGATTPGNNLPNYQYATWYNHTSTSLSFDSLQLKASDTYYASGEAPILDLEVIEEQAEIVSRGWFFGAGMGDDRFTLKNKTDADPTGFITTAADSYVVHDALETAISPVVIERVVQFPAIKPEDPLNSTAVITAANALHDAAIKYLEENDGAVSNYYEVETILDSHHMVGQKVGLTYSRTSPYNSTGNLSDTTILDIDGRYVILEMRHWWDGRFVRTRMRLGTLTRRLPDGSRMLAEKIQKLESTVRHTSAGQATSSGATGDPTYLRADGGTALSGNLSVNVGVTIDGVDISAANAAPYLMMSNSSNHSSERVLTAGDGLDLGDGGAGGNATLSVDVTDILGDGLTESGNNIVLGTPSSLSASSANGVTSSSHTHAVTSSSNPGAAAALLATDANGRLQLTGLGIGRAADAGELQVQADVNLYNSTGNSIALDSAAGSITADGKLTLGSGQSIDTASGNLTIEPAGDLIVNPGGDDVLPENNYDINLGSITKKYLALHAAELVVETLVAQDTIATIGGRILVGPTTSFTRDISSGDTTIYVKHNQMASGDRAYAEANGQVEFFAITSGPTLEGAGDYSYSVTRNLDGSGANDWYAGDALFNTGAAGDGFIDIYSLQGMDSTGTGPAIVGNVRGSATYNDWTEHWAIGNLNGLYGYATDTYGVGLGKYASGASHITIDATNGVRIRNGTGTVIGQWDASGNLALGQVTTDKANAYWNNSNSRLEFRGGAAGTVVQSYVDTDGTFVAGGGDVKINADGLTLLSETVLDTQNYVTWKTAGGTQMFQMGADSGGNIYFRGQAAGITEINHQQIDLITTDGDMEVAGHLNVGIGIASINVGDVMYSANLRPYRDSVYTGHIYVPLSTPLTSTSWDGDAYSDTTSGVLNFRTTFSIPDAAKAVELEIVTKDSATLGTGGLYFAIGPSLTYWYQLSSHPIGGDVDVANNGTLNLDAAGRGFYRINASGTGTLDVTIRVWGYYI